MAKNKRLKAQANKLLHPRIEASRLLPSSQMEMPTRQVPRGNNNSNTKARSMGMANFFVVLIQIQAAVLVLVLMGSLNLVCCCTKVE
jgi:hypothetical protein